MEQARQQIRNAGLLMRRCGDCGRRVLARFWREEDAMGVVEVILIIVVLISLVIIFKSQITEVVNKIMKSIKKDAKSVYS